MNIPIHPRTQKNVKFLEKSLPQVVILAGLHGVGKFELVKQLLAQREPSFQTQITSGNFERLIIVDSEKPSIGIDQVKDVESLLHLTHSLSRYVVVRNAERLSAEAQNAFLKTLEEAPESTYIFLLTENTNQLLATIRSRAQAVSVLNPTEADFLSWLQTSFKLKKDQAQKLYYSTNGLPCVALQLLENPESLVEDQQIIELVKTILVSDLSKRLDALKFVEKDNSKLNQILEKLQSITRAAFKKASAQDDVQKAQLWHKKLTLIQELLDAQKNNVNNRFIIDKLVLNL